jgi:flagellar motor switch protein FliN
MVDTMSSPPAAQPSMIPQTPEGEPDHHDAGSVAAGVMAKVADFAELTNNGSVQGSGSLDRLLDVTVTVAAELGRVSLPISEILKLGTGAVLELDRPVSEPVDLMVQGVRLARGEVVIIDDRFAIRIKEIADPKKRQ